MEVVLVPGVLLDGVERPGVTAGQTEPDLGTADRPEETAVPVLPHHAPPGDLLTAHGPEGAVDQAVEINLRPQELLGHHQSTDDVELKEAERKEVFYTKSLSFRTRPKSQELELPGCT